MDFQMDMALRQPTRHVQPLNLSQYEITQIKNLWSSLQFRDSGDLILDDEEHVSRQDIKVSKLAQSTSHNAEVFEIKLATNIVQFLAQRESMDRFRDFDVNETEDVRYDYQLASVIGLLSFIVENLVELNLDGSIILDLSHISSRVWNFEAMHYNIVGEGLVLTLLEVLGRNAFTPELEFTWLKFYNKLSGMLISQSQESLFDYPDIDQIPQRLDSIRTVSSASPQSSLHFPDVDIYSIQTPVLGGEKIDFGSRYIDSPLDNKFLVQIEEDDEDDSYALLNSFGTLDEVHDKKKPKKTLRENKIQVSRLNSKLKPRKISSELRKINSNASFRSVSSSFESRSLKAQDCSIS